MSFRSFFYRWIPSQGFRKKDSGEKDNYISIEIYIGMEARKSVISTGFYSPSDRHSCFDSRLEKQGGLHSEKSKCQT